MAIGRTFPESLQKALRSLEHGRAGLNCDPARRPRRPRRRRAGRPGRHRHARPPLPAGGGPAPGDQHRAGRRGDRVDPWFLDQIAQIVDERAHLAELGFAAWTAGLAAGQAPRLRRRPARLAVGVPEGRGPDRPPRHRGAGDLQDGRHLRRRVRGRDAVPLLDLRGRRRGGPVGPAQGDHPRLGPEPDRPGHRVRLLLRPRRLRPARRRLRDGDGQLQPGDRVDRLRHHRPPVLRAAHRSRTSLNVIDVERRLGDPPWCHRRASAARPR